MIETYLAQGELQIPRSTGTCCIAGGGPAGMMLRYLLARAGIEVLVLENTLTFCAISVATPYTSQPLN